MTEKVISVPFVDLKREYKTMEEEIHHAIEHVLDHAHFIRGPELNIFEKEFASFCGKKYAIGVASGTDALTLSIIGYGLKNAEIITTANSFAATPLAIMHSGNIPVFVDINNSGNIDVSQIEKKITLKTKAIIPVHLYGAPSTMQNILRIAKKNNLIVIEDACQAHGAQENGKCVPIGEIGCFSFYPAKNLGCFGDGGMIVTDNDGLYALLLQLREYGSVNKYYHNLSEGFNSRLDTLQASILSVKLKYLEKGNALRRAGAERYMRRLKNIQEITLPSVSGDILHVYHLFTILAKQRDGLREYLLKKGIYTGIHYPIPLHLQKMFSSLQYKEGDFPMAERFARETISLPIFAYIQEEEISYICSAIKEFYQK